MIQASDRFCNLAREYGVTGTEGGSNAGSDGTLYQVQGLAEDEERRGLLYQLLTGRSNKESPKSEELRGLGQR
jgi:hypothetical protein